MSTFEVIPAIDLRGGRIVRLRQGDFAAETAYDGDVADVTRAFAAAGARRLHVVDLDGARAGEPQQLDLVNRIAAAATGEGMTVELGGGLRSERSVAAVFAAGVGTVCVGTAAIRDPGFASGLVRRYGPAAVIASIDIRDGLALGEGWTRGAAGLVAVEAIRRLADAGITTFEVTAIDRDGTLEGTDLALLRPLVELGLGRIVASGGVGSIEDVLEVRAAGCAGVIVGRALYEGRIELAALLRALDHPAN